MRMIKLIGTGFVLLAAGGFGLKMTLQFHAQQRQLRALRSALEICKCELNYSVKPMDALCRTVSQRVGGEIGRFFSEFADTLSRFHPSRGAQAALGCVHGLELPREAVMVLLEVSEGLGRYDLEGANRLLNLGINRIDESIARCEKERRPLARAYLLLTLSAGAAVVILLV